MPRVRFPDGASFSFLSVLPHLTSPHLASPRPLSSFPPSCRRAALFPPPLDAAWLCSLCRAHIVSSTRASLCVSIGYWLLAVCCVSLHLTAAASASRGGGGGGRGSEDERRKERTRTASRSPARCYCRLAPCHVVSALRVCCRRCVCVLFFVGLLPSALVFVCLSVCLCCLAESCCRRSSEAHDAGCWFACCGVEFAFVCVCTLELS